MVEFKCFISQHHKASPLSTSRTPGTEVKGKKDRGMGTGQLFWTLISGELPQLEP